MRLRLDMLAQDTDGATVAELAGLEERGVALITAAGEPASPPLRYGHRGHIPGNLIAGAPAVLPADGTIRLR